MFHVFLASDYDLPKKKILNSSIFFFQILEPRFNSDTLAMLLNIPPQKTLLRRHLATNFNTLVGSQAQQEKQEFLESSNYTPLTTTAKVRVRKRKSVLSSHLLTTSFVTP